MAVFSRLGRKTPTQTKSNPNTSIERILTRRLREKKIWDKTPFSGFRIGRFIDDKLLVLEYSAEIGRIYAFWRWPVCNVFFAQAFKENKYTFRAGTSI